jgi:hypothetical protein
MNRKIVLTTGCIALLLASSLSQAQGRRPSGAGAQGPSPRPTLSQPLESGRFEADSRRLQADSRRLEAEQQRLDAEQRRLEAEQKRLAAAENDRSDDSRAEHPPNDHAADEASAAEDNALNADLREERAERQGDNRGDRGPD